MIGFDKNYSPKSKTRRLRAGSNQLVIYFCGFELPELFLGAMGVSCASVASL